MRPLHRAKQALLADRRKFSLMAGLLAVALLLWGRVLLRQVPRTAVANPEVAATSDNRGDPAQAVGRPTVFVDLNQRLQRDLFAVEVDRFIPAPRSPDDSITGGKSRRQRADEEDTAGLATGLILQSTMLGERPRAIINDLPVEEGQAFKGFVIRAILDRQVIVERRGMLFLLKM